MHDNEIHMPTYHALHKWTTKTVEKFAWIMMYGDDMDKEHYKHNILKLNKYLKHAKTIYTENDRLHDIEMLCNTVKSLWDLIKKCH